MVENVCDYSQMDVKILNNECLFFIFYIVYSFIIFIWHILGWNSWIFVWTFAYQSMDFYLLANMYE